MTLHNQSARQQLKRASSLGLHYLHNLGQKLTAHTPPSPSPPNNFKCFGQHSLWNPNPLPTIQLPHHPHPASPNRNFSGHCRPWTLLTPGFGRGLSGGGMDRRRDRRTWREMDSRIRCSQQDWEWVRNRLAEEEGESGRTRTRRVKGRCAPSLLYQCVPVYSTNVHL